MKTTTINKSTKIKLSEAMRYGLALIADGKSHKVSSQTLRALEDRGLAVWTIRSNRPRHVLTAAGEDWLGIAEECRTAPRPEPTPEPTSNNDACAGMLRTGGPQACRHQRIEQTPGRDLNAQGEREMNTHELAEILKQLQKRADKATRELEAMKGFTSDGAALRCIQVNAALQELDFAIALVRQAAKCK